MEETLSEHAGQIAAMLLEPMAGNMGLIAPARGISALREVATATARC